MRGVKRSIEIDKPAGEIWKWLSDLRHWDLLAGALETGRKPPRYRFVRDPSCPAGKDGMAGQRVLQKDRKGADVQSWQVVEWDPLRNLTISVRQEGFVSGFHAQFSVDLRPIDEKRTSVQFGFFMVLRNLALEIFSLAVPVRFLYGWGLSRMLVTMRSTLASARR